MVRRGDNARKVLGIDPSLSSTGYAFRTHDNAVSTGRITPAELRGSWRLFYVRQQIEKIVDAVKPTLVVFEDYAMGARGNNMFHIGELGGVLKTHLWERGIDVLCVPPAVMKSVIALNGRADKEMIAFALRTRFGLSIRQHDEADATGLMLLGEMRCGMIAPPSKEGKSDRFHAVRQAQIARGKRQSIGSRT